MATGVYECIGRYAENPYLIPGAHIRVWCLEELCHYVVNHVPLLDSSFENREMIDWIGEECGLVELSKQLAMVKRQSIMLESFVRTLLEAAGYPEAEIKATGRVIRANQSMGAIQRELVLGDYFLKGSRLALAYETYDRLLTNCYDELNEKQLAEIYYNIGCVFARLFYYREAAKYFQQSCEVMETQQGMTAYLCARRMELGEMEYLRFINTVQADTAIVSLVEEKIEKIRREYKQSSEAAQIGELQRLQEKKNLTEFDRQSGMLLRQKKGEFRAFMSE